MWVFWCSYKLSFVHVLHCRPGGVKVSEKWHHLVVVSCLLVLIHVKPFLVANIWLFPHLCCPRPAQQHKREDERFIGCHSCLCVSVPSHKYTTHRQQGKGKPFQGWVCAFPTPLASTASPKRPQHLSTSRAWPSTSLIFEEQGEPCKQGWSSPALTLCQPGAVPHKSCNYCTSGAVS